MTNRVADDILEGLREFTEALESGAPLEGKMVVRRISRGLKPQEYDPDDVRKTRKLIGASQMVFAMLLGVSANTVRAWEQGTNRPAGIARRFMDEIRCDPRYWRRRLEESAGVVG